MDPGATIAGLGEDAIIDILAGERGSGLGVVVPNGDDAAAYVPGPGRAQVLTTDALTDGVHFDRSYVSARDVGRKLMAVNVSDLAAMGARPRFALLSVVLPRDLEVGWLRELAAGLHTAAAEEGVLLLGGNVSRSHGALVLDATLIGEAEPERLLRRRGAQVGDDLWVSGELGGAAAALAALSAGRSPSAVPEVLFRRLVAPEPRVALGRALATADVVHSMCDVSDGLARDLSHLLAEGLGALVESASLPAAPELYALATELGVDPTVWLAGGGEEYELLFTAPPGDADAVRAASDAARTPITRIGRVEPPGPRRLVDADGRSRPLEGGFDHFSEDTHAKG
jgi:thiamine-monophosphate kinase